MLRADSLNHEGANRRPNYSRRANRWNTGVGWSGDGAVLQVLHLVDGEGVK